MSLQRLLRLLPIGLVVLVSLILAMLWVQHGQSRSTFDRIRAGQAQRDVLAKVREDCEALTFKAVAWTLTRRSSQGRQYQEGKTACFGAVEKAQQAMPGFGAALGQVKGGLERLAALLEAIQADHTDENKMVTVGRLEREVQPATAAIQKQLDDLTKAADEESARLMAGALAQQQRTLWLGAVLGLVAILVGAGLVHVITRRILFSVGEAVTLATALAEGDLGVAPRVRREDEIGKMLAAMDQARKAWISAIGEIHHVTRYLAETSDQIAQDAGTLNERCHSAASSLRNTARSMNELQSTVAASTASAKRAAELAGSATGAAHDGEAAVGEVVSNMETINAASKQIGEIVGVIDAIAFQTNLLALNAAVEAARAGEQGRGFAVVAAEVRALAQRSATAAGEIRGLIGKSVADVQSGSRNAAGASGKIVHVGQSIDQVSTMIGEVSGSASRQSREIDQLSRTIGELDELTQDNTRMVGSWTDRASHLREELQRLAELVQRFRLPEEGVAPASGLGAPASTALVPGASRGPALGRELT